MLENVLRDGQWHEPSTRYHGRVLAAFIPFAYALRKANVMNIFEGTDRATQFQKLCRVVHQDTNSLMRHLVDAR